MEPQGLPMDLQNLVRQKMVTEEEVIDFEPDHFCVNESELLATHLQ